MSASPEASIRLTNAIRNVAALLVEGRLNLAEVETLTRELEAVIPPEPPVPPPPPLDVDWSAPENQRLYNGPGVGRANPLSPPVIYDFVPPSRQGTARVTFGPAHAGSHGFVHGGWVAHVFDEILGGTQIAAGHGGMTGTLTVRYRQPTPLGHELTLTAEVHEMEGRKATASARLLDGERVLAEADAVFIRPTWREKGPRA